MRHTRVHAAFVQAQSIGLAAIRLRIEHRRRQLEADVYAARQRYHELRQLDPDNEVALSMYGADVDRAGAILTAHVQEHGPL